MRRHRQQMRLCRSERLTESMPDAYVISPPSAAPRQSGSLRHSHSDSLFERGESAQPTGVHGYLYFSVDLYFAVTHVLIAMLSKGRGASTGYNLRLGGLDISGTRYTLHLQLNLGPRAG